MAVNWINLESENQLTEIKENSKNTAVLIFKHSTRCSISRAALDRLERNWKQEEMKNVQPYYLDLLSNRSISNQIAENFEVEHESPQVLVIRYGRAIYDRSHFEIDFKSLKEVVNVS